MTPTLCELTGGKFANGAVTGAFAYTFGSVARDIQNGASLGDAIGKLWSLPTSVIGLAYGGVGYGLGWIGYGLGLQALPPEIALGNNAIQFINNPLTATATTFGNVIVYNPDPVYHPSSTFTNSGMPLGFEEMQHTLQGQALGPLYLPAHGLLGAGALLFNGNWHGPFNVLETGPHSTPPRPWP
ncbi:hypothetical protein RM530_18250 [Algiphilus sp. W345]|uniref:Uncharacterized protein n=1 Tax=Banduia mediterranea TaxID=3075609 RepID=A0ABU2WQI1_9GAMM|nr:hypothetical protein [Algiphilus sp. W345]MDT0499287.1 hypothetical protein [Algiphilus sp. W345]